MATTTEPNGVPSDPPRLPGDYDDTRHYRRRVECDRRPVTRGECAKAIAKGDVVSNPVDRPRSWRFVRDVDGMRITVAVGEDKRLPKLVKITAYVDVVDASTAWSSSRWSTDEVMVAAMLQELAGEAVDGLDARRIDVDESVPYHEHRIIWQDGFTDAYCVDCGRRSSSKDRWVDMGCH